MKKLAAAPLILMVCAVLFFLADKNFAQAEEGIALPEAEVVLEVAEVEEKAAPSAFDEDKQIPGFFK